LEQRKGETGIY